MKANSLVKKSVKIEDIYEQIKTANSYNGYKHGIMETLYVDQETINKLINDGFKVSRGDLDQMKNCLIIEW